MPGGILDDESVHLYQRALYVEPLHYALDPDKPPANGHEYIHKVRLEAEEIFPGQRNFYECMPAFTIKESSDAEDADDKKKNLTLSEWRKKECIFFGKISRQLKVMQKELMEKFPRQKFPSSKKEKDLCLFCFGSDLYKKIFTSDEVDETPDHPPLLSFVVHLSQEEIFSILQHMTIWVMQTDFDHKVCRWIYALLACLHKPLSDEYEEFLENFYDFLHSRKRGCDESEKYQIHLLAFILENYFCVKAYSLGPSLESFITDE